MFRRRDAGASGTLDEAASEASPGTSDTSADRTGGAAYTPGKGRPTPKRSEAERRRRGYTGPGDKKGGGSGSAQQSKDRARADRARKYEAMKRGEDWALTARDRGPVKGLTRDVVDSRRRFSEYYMYVLVLLFLALLVNNSGVKDVLYPVVLVLVVVVVTEGLFIARSVRKQAAVRFPAESTRGITMYAIMRTLQIRRFRMPAPRVKPGDKI